MNHVCIVLPDGRYFPVAKSDWMHSKDILHEANLAGFYYAGIICKLVCLAFANRPTDNLGKSAANLLQRKSLPTPPCILSSPRVLNFAVEEDIAHSESLPAITSSHILAQSEVSRMRPLWLCAAAPEYIQRLLGEGCDCAETQGDRKLGAASCSVRD